MFIQYCVGDKIKKNEIGGHVARMGRVEVGKVYWWGKLRERDNWGDAGVDGRRI